MQILERENVSFWIFWEILRDFSVKNIGHPIKLSAIMKMDWKPEVVLKKVR